MLLLVAQVPEAGNLRKISISADSTRFYSLYLPNNYIKGKEYPLLIFLDPAARGDFPVRKYQHIADELNIIIAGSFDSRNFDPHSSIVSIQAMLHDISDKIGVDRARIWLSGFSGGARVASTYATSDNSISGVIACGAGFAGNEFLKEDANTPFVGIVGYRDMNFEEMISIGDDLTERNKENILLLFNGDHEWPPVKEMKIAVMWLMKAYKTSDTILANEYFHEVDSLWRTGSQYLSWIQVNEYSKLLSLKRYADSLKITIETSKGFLREKTTFNNIISEERDFMDEFSFLFSQSVFSDVTIITNADTWNEKAGYINSLRNNRNTYKKLSGERLFDFCWRLCIEQYNWLMLSKQYIQAYKAAILLSFNKIAFLKPEFLMARASAGSKDKEKCLYHLKKSAEMEKLTKGNLLNDGIIISLLSENEIDSIFRK